MKQEQGNIVKINYPKSAYNNMYGEVKSVRGDGVCEVQIGILHRTGYTVDTVILHEDRLETDDKMTKNNKRHA